MSERNSSEDAILLGLVFASIFCPYLIIFVVIYIICNKKSNLL